MKAFVLVTAAAVAGWANGVHGAAGKHVFRLSNKNLRFSFRDLGILGSWQGRIDLNGTSRWLVVVENGGPAAAGAVRMMVLPDDPRWAANCRDLVPVPKSICLDGRNYALSLDRPVSDPEGDWVATFTEMPDPAGRITVAGRGLCHAVLADMVRSRCLVVLGRDGENIPVPEGDYAIQGLYLLRGPNLGLVKPSTGNRASLQVEAGRPAVLKLGVPLRNEITASRVGNTVYLSYRLMGADGEAWEAVASSDGPGFAIYRGDRKVATGTFEYG